MKDLKGQFVTALLIILTVAAAVSAVLNFQQQRKFRLPDDGAVWVERNGRVEALYLRPGGPAAKAGLRSGDALARINGVRVRQTTDVTRVLVRLGAWTKAKYAIHRQGVEIEIPVVIAETAPQPALYYQYGLGVAYLAIGLFVYFRRAGAQKATHFYLLCLASFVLSAFHYTGKLNNFDKVMYWGNVAAGLLVPTLFLHFCLSFPEPRSWLRGWRAAWLYVPALMLLGLFFGFASGVLRADVPGVELRWLLDRLWLAVLLAGYIAGALALWRAQRRVSDPVVRQQLKWLRNGALLGVAPFGALYAVPYVLGALPGPYLSLSVFSLGLIPLTWAYAVLRYRLMDVDIIFQQGYVYTLATLAVIGIFYGLIFSIGRFEELSPAAGILLILIAAFVFQPIRSWIKEQLDRYYFYKDRYDYRRTLVEFARELGAETDLDAMLDAVADRLMRTLSVERVAVFLASESETGFELELAAGGEPGAWLSDPSRPLDLSFLNATPARPYLFFERPRHPLDVISRQWPASVRRTLADLDLTYYIPCSVRGRTIAWLGLSRTTKGDFLSSDDVELLLTLAGYLGIAIENARLYRSLQRKVEEYERLKEFNENIVESINVGIVAAGLEDCVESWNHRMEELTGVPREMALGQPLARLFPPELVSQFERVREHTGVHHIYKFVLRRPALAAPAGHGGNGSNGNADPAGLDSPAEEAVVNIAVAPLVTREDQRIGRLIIFDDITERAELERRLVQADKLSSIGLLAAGVAHEVNTPLAVISTYAQMLAKQISGDQQKAALLDKIAKQTFRASEIVNSLLNFSRTSPKEFTEVDLARVIRETLSLIEHQLAKAGIEVRLELEEPLPLMKGDAGKLQQVFLNLFLNARDAMEDGGVLGVRARPSERGVEVEVSDTGRGIPPEHLHRIYDPFFTTKASRKGTGLGLAVTYGIVREHGGLIDVESRPGQGTRFHLDFPAVKKAVHV
ncbi:MAG TPA: ATP-binding protein [Bryobacteraceae bacterium]|nr:ATP-binding protein [Bryobacteraceae bacterium]